MKRNKLYIIGVLVSFLFVSCDKDFLEYEPEGVLSNENVATADNAESLVVAAYAGIANDEMIGPLTHQWVYGSVRSD
ncbi:MAG: RagB/SusD family nutrient uptake outer membrane protein, partial [Arenibacter algicola]|nr:RagB/SusD family nutrient uptake outer membrane protein [Arenibacter algicola]